MFGFVTASISSLDQAEKDRYHAVYCGLCRALKERYGQISRMALTYDLTFYVLLANSLQEPEEISGTERCLVHPAKPRSYSESSYTNYAADLSVALAYHQCLDDWTDEHKRRAKAAEHLLTGAYAKARERIPDQCLAIEKDMAAISAIERESDPSPDAAANRFGAMLGTLFAYDQNIWTDDMRLLGDQLGRFVYMMDAAVDYDADSKSGNYNPFVRLQTTPEDMKSLLMVLIGNTTRTFEKLPLEQDLHLMRSVLYSGVWQQFNERYLKKDKHD